MPQPGDFATALVPMQHHGVTPTGGPALEAQSYGKPSGTRVAKAPDPILTVPQPSLCWWAHAKHPPLMYVVPQTTAEQSRREAVGRSMAEGKTGPWPHEGPLQQHFQLSPGQHAESTALLRERDPEPPGKRSTGRCCRQTNPAHQTSWGLQKAVGL